MTKRTKSALLGVSIWEYAARLLATAVVAIVIPVWLGTTQASEFKLADQTVIGILIGITGLLSQAIVLLVRVSQQRAEEVALADARTDAATRLASIRKSYDDLLLRRSSLFSAFYSRELDRLEHAIAHTASKLELPVTQDSDTTQMMLASLSSVTSGTIMMVHFLEDNHFLADAHARHYFHSVAQAVADKRIPSVRRLLIYKSEAELADPFTKRLVAFHAHTKGFESKILPYDDYRDLCSDHHLSSVKLDFGAYAHEFVYVSQETTRGNVTGVFVASPLEVSRYIKLFEDCWSSGGARSLSPEVESMSYSALFGITE